MAKKEAVKVEKVSDNKESLAQLELAKKAMIKKYGTVVSTLAEHDDIIVPTISTGCLSLDLALGNGGMARGRIYETFGPESSGKTTLAMHVLIQAQRRKLGTLFVDAEHAADPTLFESYGADINNLDLVQGYDGESNLEILEKFIRTGAYAIAVVDSVAALVPRDEAEADIDKDSVALQARLMSKALRKITPVANQTGTTVIFVNQLRHKVMTMGNPETTTGGESLAFYATGRISVRGPESKARRLVDGISGEPYGHKSVFEIVKNKLAAPYKKAEIKLIYGQGYDTHWEILDLAASLGIVDKTGAWYKFDGKNFAQGEQNAANYFRAEENREFYKQIKQEVLEQTGLKEIYERHSSPGLLDS